MARPYPRFIYADPHNTKSAGPFIVHTLFPQLIARLTFNQDGFHQLEPLSVFVAADDRQVNDAIGSMHSWYTAKRMEEAKLSPDYYIRTSEIMHKIAGSGAFDTVSISVVHKPVMGAKLEVGKNDWKMEIAMSNEDTYHSTVNKLRAEYQRQHGYRPDWPMLGRS
jgi:hypothetical protein